MAIYERRVPENEILYKVIARQWPGIARDYAARDVRIAPHVHVEFERYLRCGILQYGFVRLLCPSCDEERVVGFSCKARGFCNACGSRRMQQKAFRLEKEVWPVVKARQWVLTFPFQVRRWIAQSSELLSDVIALVNDEIAQFYITHTPGLDEEARESIPATGSITFIQRFNSALALSTHLHIIFADGVWARRDGDVEFFPFPMLTSKEVAMVLYGIEERLERLFRRRKYIRGHGPDIEEVPQEDVPAPFKPRQPKAYRRKHGFKEPAFNEINRDKMTEVGYCNVTYKWLSLHAGVYVEGDERERLINLFRYVARSAISPSRLSYVDPGDPDKSDIRLELKRKWSDGTSALEFKQVDLVERLAEIVPEPWSNLTRYHGIFAPGHAWRDFIVPGRRRLSRQLSMETEMREAQASDGEATTKKPSSGRAPAEYWMAWAEMLRRTVGVCPEACTCGAKMVVQQTVTESIPIREMMVKMGLSPMPPPRGRASVVAGEVEYVFED